jgi:hypothetical protein
MNLGLPKGCAV